MREILFRGKRTDNCEWLYGYYFFENINLYANFNGCHYVHPCGQNQALSVIPETVGQYTGLTDKHGTRIFEGDVVNILTENEEIGVVAYDDGGFLVEADGFCVDFHANINGTDLEVIGNIHDNPELLKKG